MYQAPQSLAPTPVEHDSQVTAKLATRLRADWQSRVVFSADDYQFSATPGSQVRRMMLDRLGDELAIATSIVEYAAGSEFPAHQHPRGEEILVLSGEFCDDSGCYGAGYYLRNPAGSTHRPYSNKGCRIFVKLQQFHPDDQTSLCIDSQNASWFAGRVPGLSVLPLHDFDGVNTALVRWQAQTRFISHSHPGGEEILVLQGVLHDESGSYPAGTWLRNPCWSGHQPYTLEHGALIYVKTGHVGLAEHYASLYR